MGQNYVLFMILFLVFGVVCSRGEKDGKNTGYSKDHCVACKKMVLTMKKLLAKNDTRRMVIGAMKVSCFQQSDNIRAACHQVMSGSAEILLEPVTKSLDDPHLMCSYVGVCISESSQLKKFDKSTEKTFKASLLKILERYAEQNAHTIHKKIGKETMIKGTDSFYESIKGKISTCSLCEFIIAIVQQIFEDKYMQDFFKDEIAELCQLLPASDVPKCTEIMEVIEPKAYMALVKKYFNPMFFCPSIGLCPQK